MRDYQAAAIELGLLHHRYLRGTAPDDFAERGQRHVDRAQRRSPLHLLPRTGGAHPMTEPSTPTTADNTAMLTALVRLRGALQEARLPLELPSADGAARRRQPRWSTSSRTTSSRG